MSTRVGGVNGSITLPTGFGADFAGFDFEAMQDVADDTAYSDSAMSSIGGGVPGYRATARGFMRKGSTASSPGFGNLGGVTGGTATFQFDAGCSVALGVVCSSISASHAKRNPATGITYALSSRQAATETWATT